MEILAVNKRGHPDLRNKFYIKVAAMHNASPRLLYVFGDKRGYCIQLYFVDDHFKIDDPTFWVSALVDQETLEGNTELIVPSADEMYSWLIKLGVL